MLGEAVGFVADVLEEAEGGVAARQGEGLVAAGEEEGFPAFGEGEEEGRFAGHLAEGVLGGVELAEAAVDEDEVGVDLLAVGGLAVAAAEDLLDHGVIVEAGDLADAEAAVAGLEGPSVDEADEAADGLAAHDVSDVHTLNDAEGLVELEEAGEAFESGGDIELKDFGLDVFIDFAAVVEGLEGLELVAEAGGVLEMELLGGGFHITFELADNGGAFGFEEALEAFEVGAVVSGADAVGAGGGALADVVEEAGAKEAAFLVGGEDFEAAGAEAKDALENLDDAAEVGAAEEGSVEFAAWSRGAGGIDGGEVVGEGDFEVREGFVIGLAGVVGRLDVLDESRFVEDGFDFAAAFEIGDVGDAAGHLGDPGAAGGGEVGGGLEVGGGAVAEGLGLADVEDAAVGVLH